MNDGPHNEYQIAHMSLSVLRGRFDAKCAAIANGATVNNDEITAFVTEIYEKQIKLIALAKRTSRQ